MVSSHPLIGRNHRCSASYTPVLHPERAVRYTPTASASSRSMHSVPPVAPSFEESWPGHTVLPGCRFSIRHVLLVGSSFVLLSGIFELRWSIFTFGILWFWCSRFMDLARRGICTAVAKVQCLGSTFGYMKCGDCCRRYSIGLAQCSVPALRDWWRH